MCNLCFKIIKETKYLPRKFVMDRKIKFTGQDELAMDCGGLRVESLERFNNHWLSIVAERHPTLFIKKNDLHITIGHIPKTDKEKKLASRFIVICVFFILHTSRWPTYLDPVLASSMFNYSVKLDDAFYSNYDIPHACLEGVHMRELCHSVRKKATTGLLKDNLDPDSSLGIIKQHAEMTNVSLERVDRELKKGTFTLFVKKTVFSLFL